MLPSGHIRPRGSYFGIENLVSHDYFSTVLLRVLFLTKTERVLLGLRNHLLANAILCNSYHRGLCVEIIQLSHILFSQLAL